MSAWKRVVCLYIALTLVYAWPIVLSLHSHLPSDIGDPGLNTWILWWNSQALPLTERWWNAPMFFPAPGAFALSETFLGVAPLTIPLHRAGVPPVVVYNLIFLLSIPAAALGAHALAYWLTGRHDASTIAGAAFGFSPYRVAQIPHLQMQLACFMPLALLALHKYLRNKRTRDLAVFGVCWLLNGLMSGYFLVFFAVLIALWMMWHVRTIRDAAAIGVTLIASSLPLAPLLIGYHRYQSAIGVSRGIREIEFFSADLSAIWAASPFMTLSSHWTLRPRPEGELYPGIIVLVIVVAASIHAYRAARVERTGALRRVLLSLSCLAGLVAIVCALTGGAEFRILAFKVSFTRPYKIISVALWLLALVVASDARLAVGWRRRSPFLFYALAAAAMFTFALGPVGRFLGERFLYKAPYSLLLYLPAGNALRVPARFAMLFALCLSQGAALGFARLIRPARAVPVAAVLTAMILCDGWVAKMPTAAVPAPLDLSRVDSSAVVLELPVLDEYSATAALLRATRHGHAVANGYSGYGPPHQFLFESGLHDLDPSVITALQRLTPLAVFVASDRDSEGAAKRVMDGLPEAQHVSSTPAGHLYQLPQHHPDIDLRLSHSLPIASLVATDPLFDPSVLLDGNLVTKWDAPADTRANVQFVITLKERSKIDAVQIELGPYRTEYPRRLRVEIGDEVGDLRTVWEGGTAGAAMLGVLSDSRSGTMTLEVLPSAVGQKVAITLIDRRPSLSSSIAEIRVLGR